MFPVYILAGGKSSRFGSDKALAPLAGVPLIARVAEQFGAARITLVGNDAARCLATGPSWRCIPDAPEASGGGPAGGLLAACRDAACDAATLAGGWFWLCGCDTLFRDAAAVAQVEAEAGRAGPGAYAVAFRCAADAVPRGVWETLPALYSAHAAAHVESCVAQGERSLWRIIERAPHVACTWRGQGTGPVLHVNTPADLLVAEKFFTR